MNECNPISRYRNTNFKLKYKGEDKIEEKVAVLDIDLYEGEKDPKRGRKFKLNIDILTFNKDNLHEQLDDIEKLGLFPIEYIWYAKTNEDYENKPRECMRNIGRGTRWLDLYMKLDEEVHIALSVQKEKLMHTIND